MLIGQFAQCCRYYFSSSSPVLEVIDACDLRRENEDYQVARLFADHFSARDFG